MRTREQIGNGHGCTCPMCHSGENLQIQVSRFVELWPDGTGDDDGNSEWDDNSFAKCASCDWAGTVADFVTEEVDE